jgi:hypothetical protein
VHFYNGAVSKNLLFKPSNQSFHCVYKNVYYSFRYTANNCYFTTTKYQGDVLEKGIELCPLRYFPETIAGKESENCLCKFLGFHTFIVCCVYFSADT